MENFIVFDDYDRYPVLKGETLIYEEVSYDDFLVAHRRAVEFSYIYDKAWFNRVSEWANAR